jgi:threonylcarbamoyladenosine tRNA methylthiotransferase MtaB
LFTRGRQRAFIKVQDGCRYRCTFCIVTVARGEERSRAIAEIIDEINTLAEQGIQEVVLTGVHLGGYGSDLNCNLVDLIQAILTHTDVPRLRLGSLEPWELTEDFFTLFAQPRLMPHLHLPLQSGSDSVLKRMARRCKTADFAALVQQCRDVRSDFNLTTDIIVGFPAESESEWQESLAFIESMAFGHTHIFTYSRREGTKAASLPEQISDTVKKQRSQQLHGLAEQMKQQFWRSQIGQTFPVLWEGYSEPLANGKQRVFGYTPNYLRVGCEIAASESLENQILATTLTALGDGFIFSQISA